MDRLQNPRRLCRIFGTLTDGQPVHAVTLSNAANMQVTLISYGAAIQSVLVPDKLGTFADVTVGHASLDDYLRWPQYTGATVGRFANRIANGRFALDGREYQLAVNNGLHSLHGGTVGFDRLNWQMLEELEAESASVTFTLISPDGDQGYPGTLTVTACYTLHDDNRLSVEYRATTDAPTIVNLSNHAYWNLAGEGAGSAIDQFLKIPASHFLPTDAQLIPTGQRRAVNNSAFDFRAGRAISSGVRDAGDEQIRIGQGYDHNFVIAADDGQLRAVATMVDRESGRSMTLLSNQPGLQFYSGNFFDGKTSGKAGKLYRMGDAVALEPQRFPDSPNQPDFGSARLDPGETYNNRIEWHFGVEQ